MAWIAMPRGSAIAPAHAWSMRRLHARHLRAARTNSRTQRKTDKHAAPRCRGHRCHQLFGYTCACTPLALTLSTRSLSTQNRITPPQAQTFLQGERCRQYVEQMRLCLVHQVPLQASVDATAPAAAVHCLSHRRAPSWPSLRRSSMAHRRAEATGPRAWAPCGARVGDTRCSAGPEAQVVAQVWVPLGAALAIPAVHVRLDGHARADLHVCARGERSNGWEGHKGPQGVGRWQGRGRAHGERRVDCLAHSNDRSGDLVADDLRYPTRNARRLAKATVATQRDPRRRFASRAHGALPT